MSAVMCVMQVSVHQRWQKGTRARLSIMGRVYLHSSEFTPAPADTRLDDIHISTLTVAQTLRFALSTKTPGKRLPGVSKEDFNTNLLKTFLRMFNIRHTARTLVGDAFVRGVSGGERKRVSIAEMMATRAHVTCWDNSTSRSFSLCPWLVC